MGEVTREEFDLLSEVVELLLGVPGGVIDQRSYLSWNGQQILDRFGAMRREQIPDDASRSEGS